MKTILSILLLALALPLAAADASHGKALYEVYCTQCHGITGNGKGINAPHMSVIPRDHTDRGEMMARTDDELFKAIAHGGKSINKSVLMPAWHENLSESDTHDLVAYLRELCCQ